MKGDQRRCPFDMKSDAHIIRGVEEEVGHVAGLTIDRDTREIVRLVARSKGGPFTHHDHGIPFALVTDAYDDVVLLRSEVTSEAYRDDRGHIRHVASRADGRLQSRRPLLDVRADLRVVIAGSARRTERIIVDAESRCVTDLVIRSPGLLTRRRVLLPMDWVSGIRDGRAAVPIEKDRLRELPVYRSSGEIVGDALQAIAEVVPPEELELVRVDGRAGVVELSGYTVSQEARSAIEAAVWQLDTVLRVRNLLEPLEALVSQTQRG